MTCAILFLFFLNKNSREMGNGRWEMGDGKWEMGKW